MLMIMLPDFKFGSTISKVSVMYFVCVLCFLYFFNSELSDGFVIFQILNFPCTEIDILVSVLRSLEVF